MSIPTDHQKFMEVLLQNLQAQIGEDKPCAVMGDENYGVYVVVVSVDANLPAAVILQLCNAMIASKAMKDVVERYEALVNAPTPSGEVH